MAESVEFFVPGEPQGKGRARAANIGGLIRLHTPSKTLAYEGVISFAATAAMEGRRPLATACMAIVTASFSVPKSWSRKKREEALAGIHHPTKKPDADNILKVVCDAINGVVWVDDTQLVYVSMSKCYAETPGLQVRVREI